MATVSGIKVKREKGKPGEEVGEVYLEEGMGISGDIFAGKGDRQISIFEAEARASGAESRDDGFCITRFSENLSTRGLDVEDLKAEDKLALGDAVIEITQSGKECHSECPVFAREGNCGLAHKGAYAKVIKSGKIKIGDQIRVGGK